MALQIGGAGQVAHLQRAERAGDQVGICQRADAHHAVKALLHHIHAAVAGADAYFQQRVGREEFGQFRKDDVSGQGVGHIDAQAAPQSAGGGLEHGLQLFQVGHQLLAAFEELLAIGSQPHMSGGALQQTGSELPFQLLDHGRHTAFGQPEPGLRPG